MVVKDLVSNKILGTVNVDTVKPKNLYFIDTDNIILVARVNNKLKGYIGRYDASWAMVYDVKNNTLNRLLRPGYGINGGQTSVGRVLGVSTDRKYAYMPALDDNNSYTLYKVGLHKKTRPKKYKHGTSDTNDYFLNRDGRIIPSLLTLLQNKEAKNLPTILLPHGGPETYDRIGFDFFAQFFASQGYAVIQPQFRGSRGFSAEHLLAGRGKWGREMQNDLTDAVLNLSNTGIIDSTKVCIVGASYGGYAALAGAAFTPDLYKCVVAINGVSDLDKMLKQERKDFGSDHWVVAYWDRVIKNNNVNADFLSEISPVNSSNKVNAPALLIHGEYDKVVNVEQSKYMYKALKQANKEVKYIELEKGDHHLSSAKNRMEAMKAIEEFVSIHLQ